MKYMLRASVGLLTVSLGLIPVLRAQQAVKAQPGDSVPAASSLVNGVYRNSTFGFSYKPRFGWVERTAEMQEDDATSKPKESQSKVLLAVFERPPEAKGDTVNSAVVIAAESVKSYPGLKAAVDYFGPLEEITKARGFQIVNAPYEFSLGARNIPREDFSKNLGQLTLKQSTLVTLQKGYIVSFTFLGGTDDEVSDLIEGLTFSASQRAATSSSSGSKK
jgi:hypothetical protein